MSWVAIENGKDMGIPAGVSYDVVDAARARLHERPEYRATGGKISSECINSECYELWWLPFDHGPTVDTGVRIVVR